MAKINSSIFRAYDIRGVYPDEFNEEAAYLISRALVKFLGAKNIVASRDMRPSSQSLYAAILEGLKEEGMRIFDVGLSSTPMHTFVMNYEHADAGIMITASHNPAQYNGLKLVAKGGAPIGGGPEMEKIKEIAINGFSENSRNSDKFEIVKKDYLNEYVDFLADKFADEDFSKLDIAIDAGNGMAGMILPRLLEKLKIKYYPLYFDLDGSFPNHEANPTKSENLTDLRKLVIKKNSSLGVAFDGDADRVGFLGSNGQGIAMDLIMAFLAQFFLLEKQGLKIIYGPQSSRAVKETIEKNGGEALLCRTGHAFFNRKSREEKAYFGCETSGHCFFEDFFYADSAILTMLYVLKFVAGAGQKIEDLTSPFKKYFSSGEISFQLKDSNKTGEIIKALEKKYQDAFLSRLDGLTAEYPDWWFNIRPSNTEPLLRLNVEANNPELLEQKTEEVVEKIKAQ